VKVIGAGLPRTGTRSLKVALEQLLGGTCYHMSEVFQRPDDVPVWIAAARGEAPDWRTFPTSCVAAVDWPASLFWRELAEAHPDAVIVLSTRDNATQWWESCDATILPIARGVRPMDEEWLAMFHALLERGVGQDWDNQSAFEAYYERYNDAVRRAARTARLVDWKASDGWEPLCAALSLPVPDEPFPHTNTREEWNRAT
jgi:sulfotransferase family protein